MRKIIAFAFTILLLLNAFAQRGIDSLHQLLVSATQDTTRINLLNGIAEKHAESKPDSTFKYATEALILSRKIKYQKGEINAMIYLAGPFTFAGDFPKALEYALNALKISEILGDKELIAKCYWQLGVVYLVRKDLREGLLYTLEARKMYEELSDESNLASMLLNEGATFIDLDQLDSSRIYLSRGLEISLRVNDQELVAETNLNLGRVYNKMKEYEIAKAYFKQTVPTFTASDNYLFLYSAYNFLGEIFDSTGRYDSALYYSRRAFITANKMSNSPVNLLNTAKQLSSLFKKMDRLDSAFIYQDMAMAAKDSLTSQEKQSKMQMLTFNEQIRQMDIAEQKKKDAEARKRNLQLMGIAVFIPSFFFFVLLLGRRKVKSRTVEFLGVLSLLFVFEFIVLLTHPYIASWTHESQIWMLLILVAIAIFLVPLHHRLEKWMKQKLANNSTAKVQPEMASVPVNVEKIAEHGKK